MPSSTSARPADSAAVPRHRLEGGCHCSNIRLELELTQAPPVYRPRACDCDFCRKHGAAYVSDPHGSLLIRIRDEHHAGRYHQGSGQAEMLICTNCGVVVGVLYQDGERAYAAVNVNALEGSFQFGSEHPVSPKKLGAAAKVQRWRELWFGDVRVVGAAR